jgi:hypothetical protein
LFEDSTFNSVDEVKNNYINVDKSVNARNESNFGTSSPLLIIVYLFKTTLHNSFVKEMKN